MEEVPVLSPRTELLFSSHTGKGAPWGYSLNCAPSLGAKSTNTECFRRHELSVFVKHPEAWASPGLGPNSRGPSACLRPWGANITNVPEAKLPRVTDLDPEPRAGVSHQLCLPWNGLCHSGQGHGRTLTSAM